MTKLVSVCLGDYRALYVLIAKQPWEMLQAILMPLGLALGRGNSHLERAVAVNVFLSCYQGKM